MKNNRIDDTPLHEEVVGNRDLDSVKKMFNLNIKESISKTQLSAEPLTHPFPSQLHENPFFNHLGKNYMKVNNRVVGYNQINTGVVIIPKTNTHDARYFNTRIEAYTTLNKEAILKDIK